MTEGLAPVRESATDAEPRKAHYGSGVQPWDLILEEGWGPAFAAGCVLRYLRRDKAIEHSLESARWYATRLAEGAFARKYGDQQAWVVAWSKLSARLTPDEAKKIGPLSIPTSGLGSVGFPGSET
jgi:hypothetical protein